MLLQWADACLALHIGYGLGNIHPWSHTRRGAKEQTPDPMRKTVRQVKPRHYRHKKNRPNRLAILCYLGVLCLVPLILNKDDEFVYFHTLQGIVLWMWGMLAIFSLHVPVIGAFFFSFSALAILVLCVMGITSVLLGQRWKLPGVSLFVRHR